MTITHSHARLIEIATTPDGWLGGDGKAPPPESIALAHELVALLPHNSHGPYLYPLTEGGVSVEYNTDRDLEVHADRIIGIDASHDDDADNVVLTDAAAAAAWLMGAS